MRDRPHVRSGFPASRVTSAFWRGVRAGILLTLVGWFFVSVIFLMLESAIR